MDQEIQVLDLMAQMLSLLMCATIVDKTCHKELTSIIDRFRLIYSDVFHPLIKVKFHHLLHLADDLLSVGKSLNCFVLERTQTGST